MFNNIKDTLIINDEYIILFLYTILSFIIYKILNKILIKINNKLNISEKQLYKNNQINKTILSLFLFLVIILIWFEQIKSFITLISFISAALTLALREMIYNYVCGIYIRIKKPIKVEDRICVEELIGDVVNINMLSTMVLEVNNDTNQSTGIIVNIPNSKIFNSMTKNYNTIFKYIWDEIEIKVDLNSDALKCKDILNNIINNNEIVKSIPKKMKKELSKNNGEYRIYYNNLNPIIYTNICEEYIKFNIRYLIHPKKIRNVKSDIYENILLEFNKENIILK